MHACVIAHSFFEEDFRVRRYAELLAEKGFEVDVVTLRKPGEEPVSRDDGITVFRIMERKSDERGIRDHASQLLRFFLKGVFVLLSRSRRVRYDIVHIHNVPDFLIFMGAFPKWRGAKLILDIHDILPEFYCRKFGKDLRSGPARFLLFLERISCRFAHHIIVSNELWTEKIHRRTGLPPEKFTTLLNYPTTEIFRVDRSRRTRNGFRMVYPGTISEHHGVDIAIDALGLLGEEIPDLRFDIYANRTSNRAFLGRIQALVAEKGLGGRVTFHEPLPHHRLGEIYAEADVGVIPKRGGLFAEEAFSTKMLEFMAAGIPIVASRTKIDEYYFDDSMVSFFEPGNPVDLARRIREIHENPDEARKRADKSLEYVSRNNWAAKKRLYEEIVLRRADSGPRGN